MSINIDDYRFGNYNLKFKNLPKLKLYDEPTKINYFVEYLQGDGNSYIDTNIKPSSDIIIRTNFSIIPEIHTVSAIFGSRTAYYKGTVLYMNANDSGYNDGTFYLSYGTNYHIFEYNKNNSYNVEIKSGSITINDVLYNITSSSFSDTKNIFVLAVITEREIAKSNNVKMNSFKIEYNNIKTMELYPAISNEQNHIGEPCMYDAISDTCFYNQGTGTFLVGPKIDNPIYD